MNRKIFDYFEIAGKIAISGPSTRNFLLGCIGLRRDGAIVKAFNGSAEIPNRQIHSEYRVARKLDAGATVYVARIKAIDGEFGMSRPCPDCMKILQAKKVAKIYYTIAKNEYGTITF